MASIAKTEVTGLEGGSPDLVTTPPDIDCAINLRPSDDGTSFDVYSIDNDPTFNVKTLHLSCKSDTYQKGEHTYGGIIIYGRNGQQEWRTANGTHCKSGYVVIMQTDTSSFRDLQRTWSDEPGKVHGIIYRKAFGESFNSVRAVGEGFGIMQGRFKTISGALNPAGDGYPDRTRVLHEFSEKYVKALVEIWKNAGPGFRAKQNYDVKELGD